MSIGTILLIILVLLLLGGFWGYGSAPIQPYHGYGFGYWGGGGLLVVIILVLLLVGR